MNTLPGHRADMSMAAEAPAADTKEAHKGPQSTSAGAESVLGAWAEYASPVDPARLTRDHPFMCAAGPDPLPTNFRALLSTKTFGHDLGFSCAFRQWRAQSHCRFIHGYALGFKFTFAANTADACGWVVDFGGLKGLKQILADTFDHKLLVAADDPWLGVFEEMSGAHDRRAGFDLTWVGMTPPSQPAVDLVIVPATGCEAFARMVFDVTEQWLKDAGFSPRCWLVSVEVSEHGANSAICQG
jgi:6-pyruvoyltetrahydropterin/6-carboxytetrahydropterin synthase